MRAIGRQCKLRKLPNPQQPRSLSECEVEMLQDLAVVEMMLQGAFSGLSPPDIAAICSCLIAEEKDDAGHATEVKLANTLPIFC